MVKTPKPVVVVSVGAAKCRLLSTAPVVCPLCHGDVPPNTEHECEHSGGITVKRNRPRVAGESNVDVVRRILR